MYEQIEQIIVRTLSSLEYQKLEQLKETHTEDEIIAVYKNYGDKPISYITKVLNTQTKKIIPEWLRGEVVNQPIDDECKKIFADFNNFLEDFRNEKIKRKD